MALAASIFSVQDDQELSPNLESRIGVMFSILFVSLTAISFPGVSGHVPGLKIPHTVFFIGKHFGTGVILSTAFCHLLQDAFESLARDDVKDNIGNQTGLIILTSLLSIFLVEYISISYVGYLHANPSVLPSPAVSRSPSRSRSPSARAPIPIFTEPPEEPTTTSPPLSPHLHSQTTQSGATARRTTERTPLIGNNHKSFTIPARIHTRVLNNQTLLPLMRLTSSRLIRGGLAPFETVRGEVRHPHGGRIDSNEADREGQSQSHVGCMEDESQEDMKPKIGQRRQLVGILVLQLGIMIHSLVIGLTLSITSGADFTSLVSAIMFHQLFEGLSLGMRIAELPPIQGLPASWLHPFRWMSNWLKPTLCILFAITAPVGMAIGLLAFTPQDRAINNDEKAKMHLMQGLMSAISAGMLIYAGTVEMIAGDFIFANVRDGHGHSHNFPDGGVEEEQRDSTGSKFLAVVSLLAGVAGMGLTGLVE